MGSLSAETVDPFVAEFRDIVEGGENWNARMVALQKAKKDADASLAKMKLGAATQAKLDEADKKHAESERVLADARSEAAKTIEDAKRQAADIVAQAKDAARKATEHAKQVTDEAVANVASADKHIAEQAADAQRDRDEAAALQAKAKELKNELDKSIAAAEKREEQAAAAKKAFEDKMERLLSALAAARGG